jgi:hypothetical protein
VFGIESLLSSVVESASASTLGKFSEFINNIDTYISSAEKKSRVLRILWFISTVLLLMVTVVLTLCITAVASWKTAALIDVIIWAIFFGGTGLLFLPPRGMTAAFGTIFGISLSEVSSGGGVITSLDKAITGMATQISTTIGPAADGDPFVRMLVWTFLVVSMLVSLPAFFLDVEVAQAKANPDTEPKGARATSLGK